VNVPVNVPSIHTGQVDGANRHSHSIDWLHSFPDGFDEITTPAFVYDESILHSLLDRANILQSDGHCEVLFAIKSFSFAGALELMAPRLDGFAVSSLYEARLARSVVSPGGSIHITTPGLRPREIEEIGSLCDFVSFNSLNQWDTYQDRVEGRFSCGIRVNPQLSFVDDERYDPCRLGSKLGVPLDGLVSEFRRDRARFADLRGILFHSNCDSTDFGQLLATVEHLHANAEDVLSAVDWVNLGGGYLFEEEHSVVELSSAVDFLKSRYDVQVFFEPGAALVRPAGYIVSMVLDVFQSGGSKVVVLDTSVNHMPEVFEYDFEPDVVGHDGAAAHEHLLAGCTCLAGDLFGVYRFGHKLGVGDKVVFNNAGAYTLTKAHMFNGIALPSVYSLTTEGELVPKIQYTFDEFAARWGAGSHVSA
jgi:carboxynorspermidine decarboxylase